MSRHWYFYLTAFATDNQVASCYRHDLITNNSLFQYTSLLCSPRVYQRKVEIRKCAFILTHIHTHRLDAGRRPLCSPWCISDGSCSASLASMPLFFARLSQYERARAGRLGLTSRRGRVRVTAGSPSCAIGPTVGECGHVAAVNFYGNLTSLVGASLRWCGPQKDSPRTRRVSLSFERREFGALGPLLPPPLINANLGTNRM